MHCPHCRHDNSATTRFCTGCGAVLVESTPEGRRRRVLRPWGLARSAPLTESPAMPDILAAVRAESRRPISRRLDFRIGAGVGVVALAATFLYPDARVPEVRPQAGDTPPASPPVVVSTTATHAVRETIVVSPPLVEPVKPPPKRIAAATPPRAAPQRDAGLDAQRSNGVPTPAPAVVGEPVVESVPMPARTQEPVAAPVDRWQPLKDALARCAGRDGVIQRATCEQSARLAHCDGYWGASTLCPAVRTEYGQ
jgi:hypothetical protein